MARAKIEEVSGAFLKVFPVVIKYFFLIGDRCADPRFSRQEYEILHTLKEFGPLPISAVGRRLSISKSRMTVLTDRLIDERLVARYPEKEDRRIINIGLTPRGNELNSAHEKHLDAEVRKRFASLGPKELDDFLFSIRHFQSIMEKTGEDNQLSI